MHDKNFPAFNLPLFTIRTFLFLSCLYSHTLLLKEELTMIKGFLSLQERSFAVYIITADKELEADPFTKNFYQLEKLKVLQFITTRKVLPSLGGNPTK